MEGEEALQARGWPLRAYFVALIAVLVVAGGSAAVYVAVQTDHDTRTTAHRDAAFAATTAATQLGSFVKLTRATVAQLAANPQIGQVFAHPKGCTLTFAGIAGPDGSHLDIVRADGSVACSSRPPKAADRRVPYAGSAWLRRALRGPVFVAPAKDSLTGGRVLISAAPVAGGGGVVAAFADLPVIAPGLVSLYGGGRPVEFLVTSGDGETVIARSIDPDRWIGESLAGTSFAGDAVDGEREDLDGTTRYYASAPVPGLSWRFHVGEDKASALAADSRLKKRQLAIVLAGLAAAIFATWLIYRRVVVPIGKLSRSVGSMSTLPEAVAVPAAAPKEVAALAVAVNHLIDSVERELVERKRAEELLAQSTKMEAIGQLAGGVAHDFNNLLMAISGYGALAREKSDNPEVIGNLDEVLHAAERAGQLTHQLLAFSRRQILQVRPLDLNEIVLDTEKLLRRLIGEDIRIVSSLGADLGGVTADAGQLSQVLINLAVNARDAMPDGGTLTIETANVELEAEMAQALFDAEPGPYVRLSVSDTGVGIAEEAKRRLFEPFFTTKDVGLGTGLGLSMAYGIVKQSGGYITVYSEPNEGAVFNVYLPQTGARPVEARAPRPLPRRGTEHVLLVEDEQVVRQVVAEMLERQGYTVTSTGDPEEAVRLSADGGTYDLLITDVVMPKLNGRQLAEIIAERSPKPKVMYVSGYTSTAIVERGVLEDGVAFLQKPFALGDLATKVRETLDAA